MHDDSTLTLETGLMFFTKKKCPTLSCLDLQIEEMLNEVKFSNYVDTGEQVTKINIEDFIKLYVNHRPAFGLSMNKIQRAFQVLGYDNENGDKVIDRGDLLWLLQHRGELFLV